MSGTAVVMTGRQPEQVKLEVKLEEVKLEVVKLEEVKLEVIKLEVCGRPHTHTHTRTG